MINKARSIKKYVSSRFQKEYENGIYKLIPNTEDYVDNLVLDLEYPEYEESFRKSLKEALRSIRVFFIDTRLASKRDFTKAFQTLANKGIFDKKIFKFFVNNEPSEQRASAYFSSTGKIVVDNSYFDGRSHSFEDATKVIVHELLHYFVLMFNVKFTNKDGHVVIYADLNSNDDEDEIFACAKEYDNNGQIVNEKIESLFVKMSTFFNEGYTELLARLVYPNGSYSYEPQVYMTELLQYVTGTINDFEGFFRQNLKQEFDQIGQEKVSVLLKHAENFHKKYMSAKKGDFHEDNDYLKTQDILVDYFAKELYKKYNTTKDFSGFIKDVSGLIDYLPVPQNYHHRLIHITAENIFYNKMDDNQKFQLELLDYAIAEKQKLCGLVQELDVPKLKLSITRLDEDKLRLHYEGVTIDENIIAELLSGNRFGMIASFYSKNGMCLDVSADKKTLFIRSAKINSDGSYSYRKIVRICLDNYFNKNEIYVANQSFYYNKIKLSPISRMCDIEEDLNFIAENEVMTKIIDEFGFDNLRSAKMLKFSEDESLIPKLFIIEQKDDNFVFITQDKDDKFKLQNQTELVYNNDAKTICNWFMTETENMWQETRVAKKVGVSKPHPLACQITLENGMQLERVYIDNKLSFAIKEGDYIVEKENVSLFSDINFRLCDKIKENLAALKVEQNEE